MDKTDFKTMMKYALILLLFVSVGYFINLSSSSSNASAINSTGVYTVTLFLEPIFGIIASLATICVTLIGICATFRKSSEERRWKDVVIK